MNVLLVHDREEVTRQILEILASLNIAHEDVFVADDGVGMRAALQARLFDIAIVDLTIPHMKGKMAASFTVAEDLLTEIFNSDALNVPGDLIGLTKDVSALEKIDSKIGPHLMAVIGEDEHGAWRSRLSDRIQYAKRASTSRQRSANQHYDYDLAIITALDKEFAPYRDIFELTEHPHFADAHTFLFQDMSGCVRKGIGYAIGRAGQASAASATQAIISQFRPALCLMSGFCGGFAGKKVVIGEMILAESVVDWDFGKWMGEGNSAKFVPRPEPISIRDRRIHLTARQLVQSRLRKHDEVVGVLSKTSDGRINEINWRLGPIASGSALVAEASIISRIQDLNENILGVDMEAFGFCYAAERTLVIKPEFMVVKAVADFSDRSKDKKDQEACSYLSAKVVEEIVCHRWDFAKC